MAARPSHRAPQLGISERLGLKLSTLRIALQSFLTASWRYPIYRKIWPLKRIIAVAYLRALRSLTPRQRLYTSPPTGLAVEHWAKQNDVRYRSEIVGTGNANHPAFSLHVLEFGTQPAPTSGPGPCLLYVHGGGFAFPIRAPGHLPMVRRLAESMGAARVYLPEYTLAPAVQYPTQHVQTVEAVRHVLRTVAPHQLMLAGDSAGGNLVASVLAHLQSPSPHTTALKLESHLAGALLICPYTRFHQGSPLPLSFRENATHDYLTQAADIRFQAAYAPVYGEVYAEPAVAAAEFWRGLPVERTMVVAGEWELIRDDILDFGARLQSGVGRDADVKVVVAKHAVHVESAVDAAVRSFDGDMMRVMTEWCGGLSSLPNVARHDWSKQCS